MQRPRDGPQGRGRPVVTVADDLVEGDPDGGLGGRPDDVRETRARGVEPDRRARRAPHEVEGQGGGDL